MNTMSLITKANLVLDQAEALAKTGVSWPVFMSKLSDQKSGIISRVFKDSSERQAFYDTEQYAKLRDLRKSLMQSQGSVEGSAKSGKFVVRLPKTLHETLDIEARREGISLNQLVVTKLAHPVRGAAAVNADTIVRAFTMMHDGYAVDRVVVDPKQDRVFLETCRDLGLEDDDYLLNHALFNIRKRGKDDLPETTRKTEFRDFDDYQYGSEIAVRMLQKSHGVSLDRILCDPKLAAEFDQLSASFVSEKSVLKRRWAALNLRKTRRLQPKDLSGPIYALVSAGPVKAVPLDKLPALPAAYAFYDANRPLFAGETENLQRRIELHLEAKHSSGWVDLREDSILLKRFVAPKFSPAERQRWLRQFIEQERPVLNYQRTG